MPRYRVVAMATAISVLAVAAAWAQPSGPPPQYDPTAVPPCRRRLHRPARQPASHLSLRRRVHSRAGCRRPWGRP